VIDNKACNFKIILIMTNSVSDSWCLFQAAVLRIYQC